MALNPYSKTYYEHLKKFGSREDRVATARLSKAYCLIDPEATGWLVKKNRDQSIIQPKITQPPKPGTQKNPLPFEVELAQWDKEDKKEETRLPYKPDDDLPVKPEDDLPF